MVDRALASVRRSIDRRYFFAELKNPLWLKPLAERGCFQSPPAAIPLDDGSVQYPYWPELGYLKNIAEYAQDDVVDLLLQLSRIDNPNVHAGILDIALKIDGPESSRLLPLLVEYAKLAPDHLTFKFTELLAYWVENDATSDALKIAEILVQFEPDPAKDEKERRYKENSGDWSSVLNPAPRMAYWAYQELMDNGIWPLCEKDPYRVARILIRAVSHLICLKKHRSQLETSGDEDYSEIWCRRLRGRSGDTRERAEETIVRILTLACENVFERVPDSIPRLEQALRKQRWKIFRRIRYHLYGLHPGSDTEPWIREAILGHESYGRWQHGYEFQQMILSACEVIGESLLTEEEREKIFDSILGGPPEDLYRNWHGENFRDELFQQYRRGFHHMQLRPFSSVLYGRYSEYFDELRNSAGHEIQDSDYSPVSGSTGGWVRNRSPLSVEELSGLGDEELLHYINAWDSEHHTEDDWLIEVNIGALSEAFQSVFSDWIVPDSARLQFWLYNRALIERPIYIRAMLSAMRAFVESKNHLHLDKWLEFCEWVISHPDQEGENDFAVIDKFSESPSWSQSRRAVGDLIGACVEKDNSVPISTRPQLARLLKLLCSQSDYRLDNNAPLILSGGNQFAEAINNTRSRALQDVFRLGTWVRSAEPNAILSDVLDILDNRFAAVCQYPISLPERAILGWYYDQAVNFDQAWASERKTEFFPRAESSEWAEAFGNFLASHSPNRATYTILRDEFEFVLDNLDTLSKEGQFIGQPIDFLGRHLFTYYLWDYYPLEGYGSLLERYYSATEGNRNHWADLFDHIGRRTSNSGKELDTILQEKIIAFFEWRYESGDPDELSAFTYWLKSECLGVEWRLDSYSRTLDVRGGKNLFGRTEAEALLELLPAHTEKVVECFMKLVQCLAKEDLTYLVETETSQRILRAGLDSDNESVRQNAEQTREILLRQGRLDLLQI